MIRMNAFFAWDYDAEEEYLNEYSKKGYNVKKPHLLYTSFEKSSKVYRYQLDYNPLYNMSLTEQSRYFDMYQDAGWEFIGKIMNGGITLENHITKQQQKMNIRFTPISHHFKLTYPSLFALLEFFKLCVS